jgi:hypothetical protein
VAIPLGVILFIALMLLFTDVLKADLSWDDGTRLNPVIALFILGTGILASTYTFIFVLVAAVKLIFRAP